MPVGQYSREAWTDLAGRAVVVHARADDLGRAGPTSRDAAEARARLACGTLEHVKLEFSFAYTRMCRRYGKYGVEEAPILEVFCSFAQRPVPTSTRPRTSGRDQVVVRELAPDVAHEHDGARPIIVASGTVPSSGCSAS